MRMDVIWSLVRLHASRTAADRGNLVWLFLMPMVFSVVMGSMMGSFGGARKPAFVIYDAARNDDSARFIVALADTGAYRVVVSDTTGSSEMAAALVEDRNYGASLFIPPGFGNPDSSAALRFHYDPDRLSAQAAHTALNAAAGRLAAERAGAAASADFDLAAFDSLWSDPRFRLDAVDLGRLHRDKISLTRGSQHVGPGYTLMFVMTFMLMSAKDLVRDRQDGTLDRMRLGVASPSVLALGLMAGPLLVGIVQTAVLLGLNSLVLGIDYGDSPIALALVSLLFASVFAALSLVLATFCRTSGQADGIGLSASLLLAALGGLWWPLEFVSDFMRDLGLALPTGQAIQVYHDMIGRGWGLAETWPRIAYLGVLTAALAAAAVAGFRRMFSD